MPAVLHPQNCVSHFLTTVSRSRSVERLEPDTSTLFSPSQGKEVSGRLSSPIPFTQSYWVEPVDQERNVVKVFTAKSTQYVAPSNSSRCWRAIGPSKNGKHLKQARPATRR